MIAGGSLGCGDHVRKVQGRRRELRHQMFLHQRSFQQGRAGVGRLVDLSCCSAGVAAGVQSDKPRLTVVVLAPRSLKNRNHGTMTLYRLESALTQLWREKMMQTYCSS